MKKKSPGRRQPSSKTEVSKPTKPTVSMLKHALGYATAGYAVLPLWGIKAGKCACGAANCTRPGKHPRTRNGVKDATTDAAQIEAWWTKHSHANIGVAAGGAKRLVVLDIDGSEGQAALDALIPPGKRLPDTLTVETGRGRHLWFRAAANVGNAPLGPKLDIRCEDGYVVAPPSRHVCGARYRFVHRIEGKSQFARAQAPDWLVHRRKSSPPATPTTPSTTLPKLPEQYGEKALAEELDRLRNAPQGQRNDTLNRCAFRLGQLVPHGILAADVIARELRAVARKIGLEEPEIARTVKSGLEAGQRAPRTIGSDGLPTVVDDPTVPNLTAELARLGETDVDNAQRFSRRFSNRVAFTTGHGFLVYDGKRWSRELAPTIPLMTEETARLIAAEAAYLSGSQEQAGRKTFSTRSCSGASLNRMQDLSKARLLIPDASFDTDLFLLNVENGTIDLKTGQRRPHSAEDRLTKLAPVTYDPASKCPTFMRFLKTALRGDQEFIGWFQKAVGYSLTGDMREQVFFLVQGPGRTGKSTALNALRDLVGDYGQHTPADTLLASRNEGRIPADIARLRGSRFVTAVEVNWNRAIDEAMIKTITGGDAVTARHLYRDFFQFRPECKIWFAVNDFPKVRGTDGAFWRRARVVPFTVTVDPKDVDDRLDHKLRSEAPGILAWAVQGCLRWQREGLGSCKAVDEASERWKSAADHVKRFVAAELIFEQGTAIHSTDLYARFRSWCEANGEATLPDKQLKRAFEGAGLHYSRERSGSLWKGVKLRLD